MLHSGFLAEKHMDLTRGEMKGISRSAAGLHKFVLAVLDNCAMAREIKRKCEKVSHAVL